MLRRPRQADEAAATSARHRRPGPRRRAGGLGRARAPPLCVCEIRIGAYRWELHSGLRRPAPASARPPHRHSGDVAEALALRLTLCEEPKQLLFLAGSRWLTWACVPKFILHPLPLPFLLCAGGSAEPGARALRTPQWRLS